MGWTNLSGTQPAVLALEVVHGAVKLVQELVTEEFVINKIELPTGVGKRVSVALTWEVHPSVRQSGPSSSARGPTYSGWPNSLPSKLR